MVVGAGLSRPLWYSTYLFTSYLSSTLYSSIDNAEQVPAPAPPASPALESCAGLTADTTTSIPLMTTVHYCRPPAVATSCLSFEQFCLPAGIA